MRLYRIGNLIDPEALAQATVVFGGVGALGSQIAGFLPYSFGKIVLIDHDFITEEVIERHLIFDRSQIGRPKVDAIADWLIAGGVEAERIIRHHCRVHEVLDQYRNASVIVSTVNIPTVDNYINVFCQEHDIAAVYAGVFPNGKAGKVFVIPEPRQACLVCANRNVDGFEYSAATGCGISMDSVAIEEGELHGVPVLRWAIGSAAADAVDFIKDLLKGGDVESQMYLHAHECDDHFVIDDSELAGWQNWATLQESLSLVQQLAVTVVEGQHVLSVRRGILSFPVTRWAECPAPYHEAVEPLQEEQDGNPGSRSSSGSFGAAGAAAQPH